MEFLLFILILASGAVIFRLHARLRNAEADILHLETRLTRIEDRPVRPEAARALATSSAPVIKAPVAPRPAPIAEPVPDTPRPPPPPPPEPRPPLTLESIIGGKLPIWIGGVALVLAGFFLVRYSIEHGLLGPGARTILAALFAVTLVIGSEVTRRLPATRDDPRVAQALAGAGTASLYATLYMTASIYHFVSPLTAFVLMLGITGLAMALSLRHGPPTAVMALAGGFIAPLIAGWDAAGIGPLLIYIGLFTAALFGLAVHRGWGWLALAATGAGFAWINFLLVMLHNGDLALVGGFVVILAASASAALPATGIRANWLRMAPLVAGLVQLIAVAPALNFDALSWSFYLALSAATLFLAWRDNIYLPGAIAALVLLLLLEAIALAQPELRVTPVAAIAATVIFAGPGHLFARRYPSWAWLALGGTGAPLLVAYIFAQMLLTDIGWGLLELLAAAATASLAWRTRAEADRPILLAATLATALLAAIGLAQFFPNDWLAVPLTIVLVALALWARFVRAPILFETPALPLLAALVAAGAVLAGLATSVGRSIEASLWHSHLPQVTDTLRALGPPLAATIALLVWDKAQFGRLRRAVEPVAIALTLVIVWLLAKQILAIDTPQAFTAWIFIERALITQACLGAGWLLHRRTSHATLGTILFGLGLARFAWFDLLVLNPAFVDQWVGPSPLLNAAVLHAALTAFWLYSLTPTRIRRTDLAALVFVLVTLTAAVRQSFHGAIMTGAISTGENGAYSAAFLILSLIWLWRGISTAGRTLRIAGLSLLTLVTLKVFLIDAAALDGLLRILSFLGLGLALIAIGWAYGKFVGKGSETAA